MKYHIVHIENDDSLNGKSLVGLSKSIQDNKTSIVVPYGMDIPDVVDSSDREHVRDLKMYVKAIHKALNDKSVRGTLHLDQTEGMNSPIAGVNLIKDFLVNGRIVEREKEYKISDLGQISFSRTIKRVPPKVVNNSLVFDSFVRSKKRVIDDNFVFRTQCSIINHFMANGGEILFGQLLRVPNRPVPLNGRTISQLNRERNNTFNTRKQNIIRWCIEYINGIMNMSPERGGWDYSIIASTLWEVMIDNVYGNQHPRNKTEYGKSYSFYSIEKQKLGKPGSPTEHDTIFEDNEQVVIIDAKMYGNQRNLLTEDVIGKQFGYYDTARIKNPSKRVLNFLLIPRLGDPKSEGFQKHVIIDPYENVADDPDRIIYIYKCSFTEIVNDYYYGRRKGRGLVAEFEDFIKDSIIRAFLDERHTSY